MIKHVKFIRKDIENGIEVDIYLYKDYSKCSMIGKTKRVVYPSILKMTLKEIETDLNKSTENTKFKYMLLSRYKMDLDYFWGYGNKFEGRLYFGNYKKHVRETIKLWKQLPIKPEWLRATELIEYKNKLI